MALLLSYLEIWPERAIGAVFGDPSRLWEYDPGDPTSRIGAYPDAHRRGTYFTGGHFH
jgi:hypothetical protein